MQVPNPRFESRILGYLATSDRKSYGRSIINVKNIIDICLPTLLKEEQVNHINELESLLLDMENRDLIQRHSYLNFAITDNGYLQFKLSLAEFENIDERKTAFEKIVDSGKASKKVKKDVKKILASLRGKPGEEIVNIIFNFIRQNPDYLNEVLRIIDELAKAGN